MKTQIVTRSELHCQTLRIAYRTTRNAWISAHVSDQSALHVGCTDHPTRNVNTNLHIGINNMKIAKDWHGVDIDADGLEWLSDFVPQGTLYHADSLIPCSRLYDVIVVPEVIEHTVDANSFLMGLRRFQFKKLIITAPNALSARVRQNADAPSDIEWIEHVHEEHVSWYSPYTLFNAVQLAGYTPLSVVLLNSDSMIGIEASRS